MQLNIVSADNHVMEAMEHLPGWVGYAPLVVGLAGIATAYVMYMFVPSLPAVLSLNQVAAIGGVWPAALAARLLPLFSGEPTRQCSACGPRRPVRTGA